MSGGVRTVMRCKRCGLFHSAQKGSCQVTSEPRKFITYEEAKQGLREFGEALARPRDKRTREHLFWSFKAEIDMLVEEVRKAAKVDADAPEYTDHLTP